MIIHKPRIIEEKDEICISSKIELERPIKGIPNELWYRIPRKYKKHISTSSDSFLVAMIHLAMYVKEDIEVKGTISPKLYRGIEEYKAIFNAWCPEIFKKRINIKCNNFKKHINKGKNQKNHIACSFSGGLDSTYTFYNHIPTNEHDPDYQLTSVLYIQSRIFSNKDKQTYESSKKKYKKIVKRHNLDFLTLRTNAGDFEIKKVKDWVVLTFGGTLISSVLIYDNLISKYFVSSSYDYPNLEPCGSHPMTDYLLSTESLEIIHHGANVNKIKKTEFISKIPETYSFLRPCLEKPQSSNNCCRCGKCIRTMVALSLFNKLNKYSTYPYKLRRKFIRKAPLNNHNYCYAKENLEYAKKIGRKKIVFDLKYAIFRSKFILPVLKLIWKTSAVLKKNSKTYRKFIKIVKNIENKND